MNVIFLDVDGVLIAFGPSKKTGTFDDDCLSNLKEIVKKTDAKIVISSSWREDKTGMALLMHNLEKIGINKDQIVDMTPELHTLGGEVWDDDKDCFVGGDGWTGKRGHEIETWLLANLTKVDRFVIIDDDPAAKQRRDWLNGLFIKTNCNTGLSRIDAKNAIKFLRKK